MRSKAAILVSSALLAVSLSAVPAAGAPNNVALNKPATASSVETENGQQGTLGPDRATDGNTSTRWASRFSDPQWISVDLGTPTPVNRVVLRWEAAYATAYQIQFSGDGTNWTTAFSTTTGDGGVDDITVDATARYVRMHGTQRNTQWGYSLWEFEIYGEDDTTPASPHLLRVSDNGRFLVKQDGTPFYYLADTAWELFHRQNREDVDTYLEDRAEKGFTVIQAVALAELDGLNTPNAYGDRPLLNNNPATPDVVDGPDNDYWDHVDYIVDKAESLGMYVGFLPTWGSYVRDNDKKVFNASNAYTYGRFLGERYKDDPLIWILGGDKPADTDQLKEIWRAMARGIAVGVSGSEDYSQVMMTYHSWAETSSSNWFHNEPWLDFNAIQSGAKRWNNPCLYECPEHDYGLRPVKPTVDIEVNYDDSVVNWDPDQCCYTDYDVRKGSYWSVFAGGHGITYGTRNIWQFWTPDRAPVSYPQKYWYDSLDLPGAFHVAIQKQLMLSRPFLTRIPAQDLLESDPGAEGNRVQATRNQDGAYAFVYIPNEGQSVSVDLSQLSGDTIDAWWFNPRDGRTYTQTGEPTTEPFDQFPSTGTHDFTTPASGPDWVLVLDDASRGYGAPGASLN
jgi:hypothetical protein